MKYLLIESYVDGSGINPRISVHNTEADRERATLAEIYHNGDTTGHEDEAADILRELRETGSVEFEGDPGLQWMTCRDLVLPNKADMPSQSE